MAAHYDWKSVLVKIFVSGLSNFLPKSVLSRVLRSVKNSVLYENKIHITALILKKTNCKNLTKCKLSGIWLALKLSGFIS